MNILYLCPSQHLGFRDRSGWSTHMQAVILGLRAHGHSVRPFLATGEHPPSPSPSPGRAWVRHMAPASVRLTGRDLLEYLHDRRLERPVMNACREFEPDAIMPGGKQPWVKW